MWNRIDLTISPADKADIENLFANLEAKIAFTIAQTPDERKRAGWTASPKAFELTRMALREGKVYSNLLTAQVDLPALERDINLINDLDRIEGMVQQLAWRIKDTRQWVQKEASQQGLLIYKLLKIANESGMGGKMAVEEMQPLMPRTGKGKKKKV